VVLVDTNIILDVLENDPEWADWSIAQLAVQARIHDLAINPVTYAELALAFDAVEDLDEAISQMQFIISETPRPALFLAGKAFVRYCRAGGNKTQGLPDFFIGAQAAVTGWPLLTRDAKRYRTYFPTVKLITP
jgi:predicted nucleic acid-binding protein